MTDTRIRLLLLTDNDTCWQAVHAVLADSPHFVVTRTKSRREALKKLAGGTYAVFLTDESDLPLKLQDSEGIVVPVLVLFDGLKEVPEKLFGSFVGGHVDVDWRNVTLSQLESLLWRVIHQKELQYELSQAEAQYRSMFESSVVGMYRTSLDGHLLLANQALAQICGFKTVEAFLSASQRFDPGTFYVDPARRKLFIQILREKGRLRDFESQIRRDGGEIGWIREHAWAVRGPEGEVRFFEGTVEDISEYKLAEEERHRLMQAEAGWKAAEVAERKAAMLAEASHILSTSLDMHRSLRNLALVAIKYMADWCVLDMVDGDQIRRGVLVQADPTHGYEERWLASTPPISRNDPHNILARVIRDGKPHLMKKITDAFLHKTARSEEHFQILKQGGMTSHIIVPLIARGQTMGAMTLVSIHPEHRYSENDVKLAEDLAARASLAIDNARLYEQAQAEVEERRRAQEGLRFSERRFRTMIESSADVIMLLSPVGQVLYVSPAIMRVLGYTSAELQEMENPFTLLHSQDLSRITELFAEMMHEPGGRVATTCQVQNAAGVYRVVEFSAANLADDPAIRAAVVTFRDITERRELEWQKDAFLGIASHELKTPITSLRAFSQILERHLRQIKDEEGVGYVLKTQKQLHKLTRMVNSLLDVTRLQSGQLRLSLVPVNIDVLLHEAVDEVLQSDMRHTIVIQGDSGCLVVADRDRISQVLVNLLMNAVKYSPQAERVEVGVQEDGNLLHISVRDYGIGIAEKDIDKIFERFYRAEEVVSSVAGLGLGLYIVGEIVRQHGGEITVESQQGNGSTFNLVLPLRQSSVDY